LEPVTLNGDDGTEIRLEAGQSAVAYGEVELDLGGDSAGYIGTFYVTSEDVTEECPVTTEEAPVSTEQAPTEEPETNVSSESWVCVNGDMEAAMASTTWKNVPGIKKLMNISIGLNFLPVENLWRTANGGGEKTHRILS
jgi:hypothetical protein